MNYRLTAFNVFNVFYKPCLIIIMFLNYKLYTGVAFADDICQVREGKSSAVVEDQGAYSSVGTFVHELAHT